MKMKIIVDSNIFFSALLKVNNKFRNKFIFDDKNNFYTCHFMIVGLFKYKEKVIELSRMNEEDILEIYYELMKHINLYNESLINDENYKLAYELCHDIDEKDTPFVALTLELDGLLWTGDEELRKNLLNKNFDRFYSE